MTVLLSMTVVVMVAKAGTMIVKARLNRQLKTREATDICDGCVSHLTETDASEWKAKAEAEEVVVVTALAREKAPPKVTVMAPAVTITATQVTKTDKDIELKLGRLQW